MAGWGGLCNSHGGEFLADGDQLRTFAGSSTLVGCLGEISRQEAMFSLWYALAETWSVDGDGLSITSVDGVTALFKRSTPFFRPNGSDSEMDTVAPRLHLVDGTGFVMRIEEQSSADGLHEPQLVNWLAWGAGFADGSADGFAWETASVITPDFWNYQTRQQVVPDAFASAVFEHSYREPCFIAEMNTYHGTRPASVRYQNLTASGVQLLIEEESSAKVNTGHTDEIVGLLVAECNSGSDVRGIEIGRVEDLTEKWWLVELGEAFADPVVVAGPASLNDGDPGLVEVRNVSSSSFEIRFNEWDYLDGAHRDAESVSYVVAERGITVLASGVVIEADTAPTKDALTEVKLTGDFDEGGPIVVATVLR